MNNFMDKFSRAMRKGNAFMILIIVLVLAVVLTSLYFTFFTKKTAGTGIPNTKPESITENNEIVIDDKYDGEITIPYFDIPLNTYDKTKFETKNGLITYTGGDCFVGIDVSEFQGEIDWAAVKASGVDYAMLRSAWRGKTRGRLTDDTQFKANIEGAIENGIKVGAYIFSQATSVAEAEEEAAWILGQVADYKIDYPIVFDWEYDNDSKSRVAAVKGSDVTDYAAAFCKKVEQAGYKPMIYMNKTLGYGYYNLGAISKYDIWLAEYEPEPSFYYDFSMWQYSDGGKVDGIEGDVDVNISFVDYKK